MPRRKNITAEEVSKMKEQDASGIPRVEIARRHQCTAAAVTKKLGAVRPYRHLRRTEPQPQ